MIVALLSAFCAATIFAVVFAAAGLRNDAARRLLELEGTARDRGRPQSKVAARILASVDKTAVGAKLAEAGWYRTTVSQYVMSRFAAAIVTGALGGFGMLALGQPALTLAGVLIAGIIGFIAPSFVIDGAIKKRKQAIGKRIPDLLDMVSTTIEAGTALNSALATACASLEGPLAEEINIVLSDVRLGRSRADAFNAMAQRAKQDDLNALVTAIVQTERLGGNIGDILDELAQEARSRRMAKAEEIASRLPVLMILPMAFFMLPALFVMIFTPVVANLLSHR